MLVANPPYVAEGDPHLAELAAEPLAALVSGPEGLDALRTIIGQSPRVLRTGGWLVLEHGFDQGGAVRTLAGSGESGFADGQGEAARFTLPDALLRDARALPVLFDVAYKPARTALLEQAIEHGAPLVQGAEMLLEQGLEQFRLWTGRAPPRDEMEAAVFDEVERL